MRKASGLVMIALAVLMLLSGKGIIDFDFGDVLPIPTPTPVVEGRVWLVVVEEKGNRVEGLAEIERDKGWRDQLESKQVEYRSYDDDQQAAGPYVEALSGMVPGIVLLGPDGKVLATEAMQRPVTHAFFDGLLEEIGR